jgi:Tol biopolymer transport system component
MPRFSPDGTRLLFVSNETGDYEVYVVDLDGGEPTNLTNDPAIDDRAAWSPDGTRIAFRSERSGNSEIHVMDADGGCVMQLTDNPASDQHPKWLPDGSGILFQSTRDQEESDILVMRADGEMVTPVIAHAARDRSGSWDPSNFTAPGYPPPTRPDPLFGDHLLLTFADADDGISELAIWNLAGPEAVVNLTGELGLRAAHGAWSPDGTEIAFEADDDTASFQIWIVDAAGNNARRLPVQGEAPAWSPDGRTIAYAGLVGLSLIDARGCDDRTIYEYALEDRVLDTQWSPDGGTIVFRMTPVDGDSHIYALSMPDLELTQLTFEGQNVEPAISPDGTQIAFKAFGRGPESIWVMNLDGSDQRPLYGGTTNDFHPTWSPDGSHIAVETIREDSRAVITVRLSDGEITDVVELPVDAGRWNEPVWYPLAGAGEEADPTPTSTTTTTGPTTTTLPPEATTTTLGAAAAPSDSGGGIPTIVWILLLVAAMLAAFAGGVFYVTRRAAAAGGSSTSEPPPPPPPAPLPDEE